MALTRRLTRYEKQRLRAFGKGCLVALCLVAVLIVAIALYRRQASPAPDATLHGKEDVGYIPVSSTPLDLSVSSEQVFVYDCNRGEIVYLKGVEQVVYPASTTKLLTILCALEVLSPDEIITPGEELSLVESGSSLAYVKEHHKLTVAMLIEGMLLPSGNDAAYVLAAAAGNRISDGEVTGEQAVEVFMQSMAEYAKALGLKGTNFKTPDGLADKEHYSTLEDMLLIARAASECDIIRQYAKLAKADVTYVSGHINTWTNTNLLLDPDSPYYRASVTGLKTGSLDRDFCVIVTAEEAGQRYIIGVFAAKDKYARFADAAAIVDALFAAKEVTS